MSEVARLGGLAHFEDDPFREKIRLFLAEMLRCGSWH
jgi:hypothetical protein